MISAFDRDGKPWTDVPPALSVVEIEIIYAEALREDPQLRADLEAAKAIYCHDMTFEEKCFFGHGFVIARLGGTNK